jgi:hypothetical protein
MTGTLMPFWRLLIYMMQDDPVHPAREILRKRKPGNMTSDDVITAAEGWNVRKIVEHCNSIDKSTMYYPFDEVFKGA